jgi:hypothetical protein
MRSRQLMAFHGTPGQKPFATRRERSDSRFHSIRNDKGLVKTENRRNFSLIRLDLVESRPDGRPFVSGILEFQESEWQPIDKYHDIGPTRMLVLQNGELVDGEPIVVLGLVIIDDMGLSAGNGVIRPPIFYVHTFNQVFVKRSIAGFKSGALRARYFMKGIFESFRRKAGIESGKRIPQPLAKDNLTVVFALSKKLTWGNLWAVLDSEAERLEPNKSCFFNFGFSENNVHC